MCWLDGKILTFEFQVFTECCILLNVSCAEVSEGYTREDAKKIRPILAKNED